MKKGKSSGVVVELLSVAVLVIGIAVTTKLVQQPQKFSASAASCTDFTSQSTCINDYGCSWTGQSCTALSTGICTGYSGCTIAQSPKSCSGFPESTCENYLGCTANYTTKTGTCSGSPPCASGCSQKNNYASCSLASGCSQSGCTKSGYCTGLTSNCNGLSQTNCNLYASRYGCEWIPTCSGSYFVSVSCTGTYSYEVYSSCSGTYYTNACTGTYYLCTGTYIAPTPKPTATPTPKPTAIPTPKTTATPTPRPGCCSGGYAICNQTNDYSECLYYSCNWSCPIPTPRPTATPTPRPGCCSGGYAICNQTNDYSDCLHYSCNWSCPIPTAPPTPTPTKSPIQAKCYSSNGFPWCTQTHPAWATKPFPGGCTDPARNKLYLSSCGQAAVSSVLCSKLGGDYCNLEYNLTKFADYRLSTCSGLGMSANINVLRTAGVGNTKINTPLVSWTLVDSYLKQGYKVVIGGTFGLKSSSSKINHTSLIVGFDEASQKRIYNDPYFNTDNPNSAYRVSSHYLEDYVNVDLQEAVVVK